jgi:hypothetical protein
MRKGWKMPSGSCLIERATKVVAGTILLAVAAGFLILGISVLPITGVILAIPPLLTGILFLAAPQSRSCSKD